MNALGVDDLVALDTAISGAEATGAHAIVLTGAGRAFCTGADLTAVTGEEPEVVMDAANRVIRGIVSAPVPVIAAVNGPAVGYGVALACAADLTYAAESAYFLLSFTSIGLMPDGGATALVAASIGRARAMRLALTAERLPAATAAQWGLIAEVVPTAEFAARSAVLARELAASAPLATGATKTAINAASLDLAAAIGREETGQEALLHTADFREGVGAFNGKRAARFHGA